MKNHLWKVNVFFTNWKIPDKVFSMFLVGKRCGSFDLLSFRRVFKDFLVLKTFINVKCLPVMRCSLSTWFVSSAILLKLWKQASHLDLPADMEYSSIAHSVQLFLNIRTIQYYIFIIFSRKYIRVFSPCPIHFLECASRA